MSLKKFVTVFLSVQVAVSSAFADLYSYRQTLIESLDRLNSTSVDEFSSAPSSINRAYDAAVDRASRKLIGKAYEVLNEGTKVGQLTQQENISKASTILKEALTLKPILLNQSYSREAVLIEKLVLMALFPANPEKVTITFEGVEKSQGLWLLASSIADPKTIEYDNGVKSLITGQDIYGNESGQKVKFLVEASEIDIPGTADIKIVSSQLQDVINATLPIDTGIKGKIRIMDRRAFLYYEFVGYKYVELANDWILGTGAYLGGNRFIFKAANGLEKISETLQTSEMGGISALKAIVNSAGKKVGAAEKLMRSRLAATWFEPTVDTVLTKINNISSLRAAHMQANLEARIAAVTASGIDAADKARRIEELTQQTAQWAEKLGADTAKTLKNIEEAVAAAKSNPTFASLSKADQSRILLRQAEKASNLKIWQKPMTYDKFMKSLTIAIAGYYIIRGVHQMYSAETSAQRKTALQYYGIKSSHALMYAVPYLRESAAAIDLLSLIINLPLEKRTGIHMPDTEDLLTGLVKGSTNVGFWLGGLSSFDVDESDLRELANYSGLYFHPLSNPSAGRWKDRALQKLMNKLGKCGLNDNSCLIEVFVLSRELEKSMAETARKEIFMIYGLNLKTDNEYNKSFGKYEEKASEQFLGEKGYYLTAIQALKNAKNSTSLVIEELLNGDIQIDSNLRQKVEAILTTSK